ncbi:hypothetical protein FB45DRAFT_868949 [Roridomyces roridus]|uniref:Uncharacterized protein n=1 Tax=Roridomyces roridus TaxID=1738132 RepID=A0AAD7BN55_9AGAR|nr:hypothetical protein FB45DRAFT_868949 [Roridomyces roridus]
MHPVLRPERRSSRGEAAQQVYGVIETPRRYIDELEKEPEDEIQRLRVALAVFEREIQRDEAKAVIQEAFSMLRPEFWQRPVIGTLQFAALQLEGLGRVACWLGLVKHSPNGGRLFVRVTLLTYNSSANSPFLLLDAAYAKEGFRFHFASIVNEEGGVLKHMPDFYSSGPQHAKVYTDLATRAEKEDWDYRFTLKAEKWSKV